MYEELNLLKYFLSSNDLACTTGSWTAAPTGPAARLLWYLGVAFPDPSQNSLTNDDR